MIWIIAVLALVFILVVVIGFTKFLIKTAVKAAIVFAILILIISSILFIDRRSFESQFPEQQNLFLFVENGTLTHGFRAEGFASFRQEVEVEEYQDEFDNKEYIEMLDDEYKVLVFDISEEKFEEIMFEESFSRLYREYSKDTLEVYPKSPIFIGVRFFPFLATI